MHLTIKGKRLRKIASRWCGIKRGFKDRRLLRISAYQQEGTVNSTRFLRHWEGMRSKPDSTAALGERKGSSSQRLCFTGNGETGGVRFWVLLFFMQETGYTKWVRGESKGLKVCVEVGNNPFRKLSRKFNRLPDSRAGCPCEEGDQVFKVLGILLKAFLQQHLAAQEADSKEEPHPRVRWLPLGEWYGFTRL